jgi:hypothetical protein
MDRIFFSEKKQIHKNNKIIHMVLSMKLEKKKTFFFVERLRIKNNYFIKKNKKSNIKMIKLFVKYHERLKVKNL